MSDKDFARLVSEVLAPPFLASGYRPVSEGVSSELLVGTHGVFRAYVDPREGVEVDFLTRSADGAWRSFSLGYFLVKRADRAGIPRTRVAGGGPLSEARLKAQLDFYRKLFEAVGQDLLGSDRQWLQDYPWPAMPLPESVGRDLDLLVGTAGRRRAAPDF